MNFNHKAGLTQFPPKVPPKPQNRQPERLVENMKPFSRRIIAPFLFEYPELLSQLIREPRLFTQGRGMISWASFRHCRVYES
jgi:hypothetical protein